MQHRKKRPPLPRSDQPKLIRSDSHEQASGSNAGRLSFFWLDGIPEQPVVRWQQCRLKNEPSKRKSSLKNTQAFVDEEQAFVDNGQAFVEKIVKPMAGFLERQAAFNRRHPALHSSGEGDASERSQ